MPYTSSNVQYFLYIFKAPNIANSPALLPPHRMLPNRFSSATRSNKNDTETPPTHCCCGWCRKFDGVVLRDCGCVGYVGYVGYVGVNGRTWAGVALPLCLCIDLKLNVNCGNSNDARGKEAAACWDEHLNSSKDLPPYLAIQSGVCLRDRVSWLFC